MKIPLPTRRELLASWMGVTSLISTSTIGPIPSNADSENPRALILAGYLMSESAYQPYVDMLLSLGYDTVVKIGQQAIVEEYDDWDLVVGHSRGAKRAARAIQSSRIGRLVLLEPVDVDPPKTSYNSTSVVPNLDYGSVLAEMKQAAAADNNIQNNNRNSLVTQIKQTPTLIIAAPLTGYSKRYGPAENLCAPRGQDSRAFYEMERDVLHNPQVSYVSLPQFGHNDLVNSTIIGCEYNAKERAKGPFIGAYIIEDWLRNNGTTISLPERVKARFGEMIEIQVETTQNKMIVQ